MILGETKSAEVLKLLETRKKHKMTDSSIARTVGCSRNLVYLVKKCMKNGTIRQKRVGCSICGSPNTRKNMIRCNECAAWLSLAYTIDKRMSEDPENIRQEIEHLKDAICLRELILATPDKHRTAIVKEMLRLRGHIK